MRSEISRAHFMETKMDEQCAKLAEFVAFVQEQPIG